MNIIELEIDRIYEHLAQNRYMVRTQSHLELLEYMNIIEQKR